MGKQNTAYLPKIIIFEDRGLTLARHDVGRELTLRLATLPMVLG